MTRRRAARPCLAAILALAAAAGCDRLPGRPTPADRPRPPSSVHDFATLWSRNCAGCHGADGRLGAAQPLADPLYLAWVDDASLRRVTAEGVPGTAMPGFARAAGGPLTPEQLEDLIRGLRARWGGGALVAALPPYAAPPGDPVRGAAVFAARCADCHGSDGRGGRRAGSVVDPAFLSLVSDQALRSTVVAGRPDLGMPDFRRDGGPPLDAGQVADVVAWLAARRPRAGSAP